MLATRYMTRFIPPRAVWITFALGVAGRLSAQPADAAEDIRGPKPLVEIPVPPPSPLGFWLGFAGGVVLLGIVWFIWRHYRGRQRMKSPPEIALASLAQLETNRESLEAEAFANRAAQTVRQYIADRFGLAAPRRTTEEFLQDLAKEESSSLIGERDHLRVFLKSCDLAKFAGSRLDAAQRGELLQAARGFIQVTSVAP